MRGRLLAAALGILVLGALLARGTGRGAAWAPFPSVSPPRLAAPPPSLPALPAVPQAPTRNLFQYADARPGAAATVPPVPVTRPRESHALAGASPSVAPSPAVRVAGLVRRGGQLKAALVVEGEMTVAGRGERAGEYVVLEVSDETGVRLRGPAGDEMLLPPPPF